MECLYDEYLYDDCLCDQAREPADVTIELQDDGCMRGVFYGLLFVAPFWIAVIAAIKAF